MRHHIERQAAAVGLPVVPARTLAFLLGAVEDPRAGIDLDRQDAAEEARLADGQQLGEAGQEQLVLDDAVPEAGALGQSRQFHRLVDRGRRRLLDEDVLARGDRLPDALRPAARCRAIHEDLLRTGQRLAELRGPARVAVGGGQLGEPPGVAADEQQFGDQPVAVAELQPALRGDGQEIAHVLDRPHAARGAVDDDANSTIAHVCLLPVSVAAIVPAAGVSAPAGSANPSPPSLARPCPAGRSGGRVGALEARSRRMPLVVAA